MEMYQDGVRVWCLPDGAHCYEDELGRCQLVMNEGTLGNEMCNVNCQYYEE